MSVPAIIDGVPKPELFDHLWRFSQWGLAIVAVDGTFLHANPAYCALLGYTEGELQKRTFQSITHPDDLRADVQAAKAVASADMVEYGMLKQCISKSGSVLWVQLHVSRVERPDGSFVFFMSQVNPVGHMSGGAVGTSAREQYECVKKARNWDQLKVWGAYAAAIAAGVGVGIQQIFGG